MDHSTKTWRYDPPTPKPPRKVGAYFAAAIGLLIATGAMVLIAGGN